MEITTTDSFLKYYARIRERTLRVVQCIPPDKIEWWQMAFHGFRRRGYCQVDGGREKR